MKVHRRHLFLLLCLILAASFGFVFLRYRSARAADGSGLNAVTPLTATAGTSGNSFTFVFTPGETMSSGEIAITAPSDWTAPQGSSGTAGYTTAASTLGTIGTVEDAADSATGWSAGNACASGLTADTTTKHEGVSSIRCVNGNEANNDRWYKNITAENWAAYTKVGFWIHSSANIAVGNLRFAYDNDANIASPIEQISFPSAISANTWTYVVLPFTSTAAQRASVASYGFVIRSASALDSVTVRMDDLLIGPGIPTFPGGGDIRVRLLQLDVGQTATIVYGSGGGASGVTAPTTVGVSTFLTRSRVSDAGSLTAIGVSPTITVSPAPASYFLIDDPTDGTVDASISVTVRAFDPFGNLDVNYQNDVTLVADGSATGDGQVDIVNGVGTIAISDTQTETVHLSLSDTQGTGLTVTSTQEVVFLAGQVAAFFLDDPGDMTAGTRLPYHVTRKDQYGNPVTIGSTTVYLYSTSPDESSAFYDSAVNGGAITSVVISSGTSTADFWYQDERAGTWNVTVSDHPTAADGTTGIDDASDAVTVLPASPAQLFLSDPGDMTAGTRVGYVITRKDQYGNAATSGNTTAYVYSNSTGAAASFFDAASGGSQVTSVAIANGTSTANVWYADEKSGTWIITASDNATAPDGATGLSDGVDSVTVGAANTSQFVLDDPGDMAVDTRIGYSVTRKDAFGNLVSSGTDSVYLYTNSSMGNAAFYNVASGGSAITAVTIPNGQSATSAWYFDDVAGNWTITASDNATAPDGATGIDDAQDAIGVTAAPVVATRFVIEDPTDGTVDASVTVTVKAVDESGDVDTGYQTDVTLLASGTATGEGLVDIVNGEGTVALSDTLAETVQLSVSDSEGTGLNVSSTQDLVFAPGAVTQFTLSDPGDATTGAMTGYLVGREDQYGNAVTAGNTTAYLYTNSTGAAARFFDAPSGGSQITSVLIPAGTSTASVWYYDEKAGGWSITASDNATAADGTTGVDDAVDGITIAPGAVTQFTLSDPGDMNVGTRLGYLVTRKDQYANPVTAGVNTVYVYSNSTGISGFFDAASGGTAITSRIILAGQATADVWYFDETEGTWTITASDNALAPDGASGLADGVDTVIVQNIPIVATRFVLLDPNDAMVGTPVTVTVQAQDNSGNIDVSYQDDVSLITNGSVTGGGLIDLENGVGTTTISDTVAETVTLSLMDTRGTGLDVSSIQSVVFSSTPPSASSPRGGGGGAGGGIPSSQLPKGIRLSGQAYPGATVRIVIRGQGVSQVVMERSVKASDGSFAIMLPGPFSGSQTIGVTIADRNGQLTPTRYFSPYVPGVVLLEKRIPVVPTIRFKESRVPRGTQAVITGYAAPRNQVELTVDEKNIRTTVAGGDGSYAFTIDTDGFAIGSHVAKVKQRSPDGRVSDYSLQRTFMVSTTERLQLDLNGDGKVNVSDWSIFLSKWKSTDPAERDKVDLNGDGKTDLEDFSIFVRGIHL
jgi:hypothetical protein